MSVPKDQKIALAFVFAKKVLSIIEEKESHNDSVPDSEKLFTKSLNNYVQALHNYTNTKNDKNMDKIDEARNELSEAKQKVDRIARYNATRNTCNIAASTSHTVVPPIENTTEHENFQKYLTAGKLYTSKLEQEIAAYKQYEIALKQSIDQKELDTMKREIDTLKKESIMMKEEMNNLKEECKEYTNSLEKEFEQCCIQ